MDAELRSQLDGSTTSLVSRNQVIDVLGKEPDLDLPSGWGGWLPSTSVALGQPQEAVPRV
ncbi:MAG TPA: hypothetical protein VJ851_15280 [Jatrophihabitans sp.]|nr:hypothetical protein [Jatrophihabitans sp.]